MYLYQQDPEVNTKLGNVVITDLGAERTPDVTLEGENGGRIAVSGSGPSTSYLQSLGGRINHWMNSVEFKTAVGAETLYGFHRDTDAPTPIVTPTLTTRHVTVNMKDPYDNNSMPAKLTVSQGSTVTSKPSATAVLVSCALQRFDTEVDGVITELTLEQEFARIVEQLNFATTASIVKAISEHPHEENIIVTREFTYAADDSWSQIVELAEDAIDAGMASLNMFGFASSDFVAMMTPSLYRLCDRAARRAGTTTVSEFFGMEVTPYESPNVDEAVRNHGIILAPKRAVAVSFREKEDGEVFKVMVSRQPEKQASTLEVVCVADLLIEGSVRVNKDDGSQDELAVPLLRKFVLKPI